VKKQDGGFGALAKAQTVKARATNKLNRIRRRRGVQQETVEKAESEQSDANKKLETILVETFLKDTEKDMQQIEKTLIKAYEGLFRGPYGYNMHGIDGEGGRSKALTEEKFREYGVPIGTEVYGSLVAERAVRVKKGKGHIDFISLRDEFKGRFLVLVMNAKKTAREEKLVRTATQGKKAKADELFKKFEKQSVLSTGDYSWNFFEGEEDVELMEAIGLMKEFNFIEKITQYDIKLYKRRRENQTLPLDREELNTFIAKYVNLGYCEAGYVDDLVKRLTIPPPGQSAPQRETGVQPPQDYRPPPPNSPTASASAPQSDTLYQSSPSKSLRDIATDILQIAYTLDAR
tara:strand:- start:401 stop:1438 length:1038 start_codon:yes stop_codon:yes gene_type:complete